MGIDQTGRILIQCAYKEELETLREELILHMKEREQLHSDIRRLCRLASKKERKINYGKLVAALEGGY
jgi:hypothetical protein